MSGSLLGRRRLIEAGAAGLALVATPRALGLPAAATTAMPEKIVIGTLPFDTEVTAYVGDVDYFKEEGLGIELFHGRGGPAVVEALIAGAIPLGDVGIGPAILASARGLPLVQPALGAIGTPTQPFSRIMVRGDSAITDVAQLKGKKLALHQRGTMEDLGLAALKKVRSIGHEDLEIVLVPAPSQPQALEQSLVDAIYALPPADAVAEHRFHARTLINTADFIPYLGYGTLAMRRDFVEAYPDAAKKVMRAWCRFCRWIDDNAAAARNTVNANLDTAEDLRADVRITYFARNGLPVMPNLYHIYQMLVAGKAMDAVADPAKLFEESVLEPTRQITLPVLDELGWDKDAVVEDMLRASYPLLPKPPEAYYAEWEKKLLGL
ncbi:MAG TPA: ABC transporter substrate-binding protein [Stellaceae bacterium]|nr:ABC transporter substrate-binding protein [Stellaceae bacterium]